MTKGSTAYYRETLKETIMSNYGKTKATPLASSYTAFKTEIKNSASLQPEEKESYLVNLQKAYEQTRDELFGAPEE